VVKSVFHRDGKTHQGFLPAWDTACCKAGLDTKGPEAGKVLTTERIPHEFRRTAVRNLSRVGVSEKTAMELTRHKAREVFQAPRHRRRAAPHRGGGKARGGRNGAKTVTNGPCDAPGRQGQEA